MDLPPRLRREHNPSDTPTTVLGTQRAGEGRQGGYNEQTGRRKERAIWGWPDSLRDMLLKLGCGGTLRDLKGL